MKTPHIDEALKLIKTAKTDKDLKKILAQLGSDAEWDSTVGNECTNYSALWETK